MPGGYDDPLPPPLSLCEGQSGGVQWGGGAPGECTPGECSGAPESSDVAVQSARCTLGPALSLKG